MNVRLLIQQAYRWAEIIAEEGEDANSTQLNTGLNLLNKILRKISIHGSLIPIETKETFTLPQGVKSFNFDGWTTLSKVQYNLGNVLVDIRLLSLNDYRNISRIINTTGIPYIGYPRRTSTGIVLEIFFSPTKDYDMTVDGFKSLTELTLEDEPEDVSKFMEDYLEIQLASNLRSFYQLSSNIYLMEQLAEFKTEFKKIKEHDIDMITTNTWGSDSVYSDTAQLTIGRGWQP